MFDKFFKWIGRSLYGAEWYINDDRRRPSYFEAIIDDRLRYFKDPDLVRQQGIPEKEQRKLFLFFLIQIKTFYSSFKLPHTGYRKY